MAETLPILFASMNTGISLDTLRSVAWLGQLAKRGGFDGVDLAPTLDFFPGHSPRAVRHAKAAGLLVVGGLHSPVRGSGKSGKDPGGYRPSDPKAIAGKVILGTPALSRLVMPTVEGAASVLDRYQNAVGERLPICFFPLASDRADEEMRRRANGRLALLQAKDDAVATVGVYTPRGFVERVVNERRYDGIIGDTGHYGNVQATGTGIVSNIDNSLPIIAPYFKAVHFAGNRTDLGGEVAARTRQDARNILDGKIEGQAAEVLSAARDCGQVEYAVLEWTIPDMFDILKERRPNATPTLDDAVGAYRHAADVLADFMGRERMPQ